VAAEAPVQAGLAAWRLVGKTRKDFFYCEIIKHAVGPRAAFELTLFGQIYDLAAATRLGIVQQTVAPDKLQDAAVAWAALVPPDCYTAYAFSKRAPTGNHRGSYRQCSSP